MYDIINDNIASLESIRDILQTGITNKSDYTQLTSKRIDAYDDVRSISTTGRRLNDKPRINGNNYVYKDDTSMYISLDPAIYDGRDLLTTKYIIDSIAYDKSITTVILECEYMVEFIVEHLGHMLINSLKYTKETRDDLRIVLRGSFIFNNIFDLMLAELADEIEVDNIYTYTIRGEDTVLAPYDIRIITTSLYRHMVDIGYLTQDEVDDLLTGENRVIALESIKERMGDKLKVIEI